MNLTAAQQQLIRDALKGNELSPLVTAEQRAAIQAVCSDLGSDAQTEKCLIAFKSALVDAANDLDVPHGAERDVKLSRLVSVFIDELYARARNGEART